MREHGTSYAVSLNLAHDRAGRDRQAADVWRRLHAQPDVDADETSAVTKLHPLRVAIAGLLTGLLLRRTRPTI